LLPPAGNDTTISKNLPQKGRKHSAMNNQKKTFLIHENIPLADKNWFKTGGPARYFCEPETASDFQQALAFAKEHFLELFFLGEGANILISDEGFNGLVIHPRSAPLVITDCPDDSAAALVTAPAGLSMNECIEKTLASSLTGLEVFSGIPGSLGGCAYINLHYFHHFFSDFLVSAQVIEKDTNTILEVDLDWFKYGYNTSTLMTGNYFVISVTLKLQRATATETAHAQGRRYEIIRHRASRYPASNTCGSFFRNFYEEEVTLVWNNKKMIHVAFYLDKIGVKGTATVGGACVSWQHANMLVNKNNATSTNIVNLARMLQEKVKAEFGIIPRPECIFVGFKEYPLLDK
jgi:UDP-N-acetylmuramate dehydrogenase